MFQFAHPYFFLLLVPVGVAAWFVYRRKLRSGLLFSPVSRLPVSGPTARTVAAAVLPALFLLGLALLVLALARPQTVFSRIHNRTEAIGIEMVVDVSGTMRALDLSVKTATGYKLRSRLDAAKDTFADFVAKRPDDLIGLVTFGGFASTRAPLTADHQALVHVLKGVEIPTPGIDQNGQVVDQEELLTAIGDALATACARLEPVKLKSRIVVLLTDGESNTGIIKPEDAVKIARKLGVKVYTIGVGSNGEAPFPAKDMFGQDTFVRAQVTMDEELLRTIAKGTGGRYFNVRDAAGFERAMNEINRLEKTAVERNVYSQHDEWFPWLLWPAVGLVVLGAGLNSLITRRLI